MKKARIAVVLLLGIMLVSGLACGGDGGGGGSGEFAHYPNSDYGYSIDYPKYWHFEQISDGEIGVKPKDSEYNQIQIRTYPLPLTGSMPEYPSGKLEEFL